MFVDYILQVYKFTMKIGERLCFTKLLRNIISKSRFLLWSNSDYGLRRKYTTILATK